MFLKVHDLTIHFGKSNTPVVSSINFNIKQGECLGLVGESGSGKSLTALAIMQLLPTTASVTQNSQIFYKEQDLLNLTEKNMRKIRGPEIGMIFQDAMSAFNPVFTIGNQLIEVIDHATQCRPPERKKIAYALLHEVGIEDAEQCFTSYPHQLSGGMRQRAMIAMALAGNPKILIADEPTTALDVTIQAKVLELLKSLQKKHNLSLLFISHDLAVVSQLADRIAVMQAGKILEIDDRNHFFLRPKTEYTKRLLAAIPSITAKHEPIENNQILLNVKQLKVYFPIKKGILKRTVGHIKAVDQISFHLMSGETLALVGESGSGKSTTAKAILKLIPSNSDHITLNGADLTHVSKKQFQKIKQDIQIIFQDPYSALNPRMIVFNCIAEGLIAQKKIRNKQEAVDKVNQALEQVGLAPDTKWRFPHEFSGGQRQRICIARALVLEPKLLILDEPTSALDVSIQMQILELLERLQKEFNLSYLLITHNLSVVAYMAHRMAIMHHGKLVEQGATQDILTNPQNSYTKQLIASIPNIKLQKENA